MVCRDRIDPKELAVLVIRRSPIKTGWYLGPASGDPSKGVRERRVIASRIQGFEGLRVATEELNQGDVMSLYRLVEAGGCQPVSSSLAP
jgi:hypothetical protein